MNNYSFHPIADDALLIQFNVPDKQKLLLFIHHLTDVLLRCKFDGVVDIVPAFESVAIYYNPLTYTYQKMINMIEPHLKVEEELGNMDARIITIPICYDESVALDLVQVAEQHNLTTFDVVNIHSSPIYTVAIMGFLPGFPYLIGLDERLWTPRKATPRTHVPKGAVGIGGSYTGIYSLPSPGGWNIIGQTPLSLYNNTQPNSFLLQPGDQVTFQPITKKELEGWQ